MASGSPSVFSGDANGVQIAQTPFYAGGTITIYGTTFNFVSAYEDETSHTDTYSNSSGDQIALSGVPGNNRIAYLTGYSSSEGINGYWQDMFHDSKHFTPGGNNPYDYYDYNQYINYHWSSGYTSYNIDFPSSQVSVAAAIDNYSGDGGTSFTVNIGPDNRGAITGSENGYVVNGQWGVNTSGMSPSPQSAIYNFNLLEGANGSFDYHYNSGVYSVSYDSTGAGYNNYTDNYISVNGGWASRSYSSNPSGSVVQWTGYDPAYGTWSADADGNSIVNRFGPYFGNLWSYSGPGNGGQISYSWTYGSTSYALDGSGQPYVLAVTDNYSSSNGNLFTVTYDSNNLGTISGSEYGYIINGTWYVSNNGTTSSPSRNSWNVGFFSANYVFAGGSYSIVFSSNGSYAFSSADGYSGPDGASAVYQYCDTGSGWQTSYWSGWEPYIGSWSQSSDSGFQFFDPRYNPSFAPAQLWVNSSLVTWMSGTLDGMGTVTDNYSGNSPAQGNISLTISGGPRDYVNGAIISASVSTNSTGSGSGSYANGMFSVSGWDIQASDPNRSMPVFWSGTSLWVNGTEYVFSAGYTDEYGNSTDTYSNGAAGTITLSGNSGSSSASLWTTYYGGGSWGYYDGAGNFSGSGLDIQTHAPVYGPPAFWINGVLYTRTAEYENRFSSPNGQSFSIDGMDSSNLWISGSEGGSPLNGSYYGAGGIFILDGRQACPANADGSLQLAGNGPPTDLPPAFMVSGYGIWQYLGMVQDDAYAPHAFYGNAAGGNALTALLSIRTGDDLAVSLHDYSIGSTTTGTYSLQSHLIQTTPGQLPMPILGVDPLANNALWGLQSPPSDRPASVLVRGDVWRFSGTDASGNAVYAGYYSGQTLTLDAAGPDGITLVAVTDPYHGDTSGRYNEVRHSFKLDNGTPVHSGDSLGDRVATAVSDDRLQTFSADLDVIGDVFTLGSLMGDASTAGLTMNFSDDGTTATLGSALGRPSAEWTWSRADATAPDTSVRMMKLDSGNRLSLQNPNTPDQTGIVLDPNGGSRINGPLRVPQSGDLDMGEFTHGPRPDGSTGN